MHIKNSKGERELLLDNNNSPVEFIDGGLIRNFPIDLFDKKEFFYLEENNIIFLRGIYSNYFY